MTPEEWRADKPRRDAKVAEAVRTVDRSTASPEERAAAKTVIEDYESLKDMEAVAWPA